MLRACLEKCAVMDGLAAFSSQAERGTSVLLEESKANTGTSVELKCPTAQLLPLAQHQASAASQRAHTSNIHKRESHIV